MHTFEATAIIDLFMHVFISRPSRVGRAPLFPNLFTGVIGFTWDYPTVAQSL